MFVSLVDNFRERKGRVVMKFKGGRQKKCVSVVGMVMLLFLWGGRSGENILVRARRDWGEGLSELSYLVT